MFRRSHRPGFVDPATISPELNPRVDPLTGYTTVEQFLYHIRVEHDGALVFEGEGDKRALVEQALRVICDLTQPTHLVPLDGVTLTINGYRLRPTGPVPA